MYIYIHTHTRTHAHSRTSAYICIIHMYAYFDRFTNHTHMYILIYIYIYTHTHALSHTHAHSRTSAHICIIYMYLYFIHILIYVLPFLRRGPALIIPGDRLTNHFAKTIAGTLSQILCRPVQTEKRFVSEVFQYICVSQNIFLQKKTHEPSKMVHGSVLQKRLQAR